MLKERRTFLFKQKKVGDRIVNTQQDIDRGLENWCSQLICRFLGEQAASGAHLALGINIQFILVPHQEYLFTNKQPFCSFLLSYVFQVNSQQISISTFPTSHLPSGRIQLEKKEKKNHILLVFASFPHPPPLPLSCLLSEGEKNISTQRQHCNLFFTISHGAQIEIELDRDIRSARCDNCKRILFKNTLTFVHPVSNI